MEKMGQSMSSLAPECNELKAEYDHCFTNWYEKFLAGKSNQNECQALFDKYQACIHAALAKDKVIKKNLEEARAEAPFEKGGANKDE